MTRRVAGAAGAGLPGPDPAGRLAVVAGLDAGATKLAVRIEAVSGGRLADGEFAASGWEAEPAGAAADWLLRQLRAVLPPGVRVAAAGIGAQGCDSAASSAALEQALASRGLIATVVNDGALLIPAAGLRAGIGIVAGTGSVGVGADAAGGLLLAGGWGWVLGDEGGAAAIVREATRAALAGHDQGQPDDGLLTALLAAFAVPTVERLARVANDEPTVANWAPHAEAVFAAADAGSGLAADVIGAGAAELAELVGRLVARGAQGSAVVAAGGVITRQPRLWQAFRAEVRRRQPQLDCLLLAEPPVSGAVVLARRLLATARTSR